MRFRLPIALLLILVPCAAAYAGDEEPARRLAQIVDLPTREARRKQAVSLAGRKSTSPEEWVKLCRGFRPLRCLPAGTHDYQAELQVGAEVEDTPITVYVPESCPEDAPAPLLMAFHGAGSGGRGLCMSWQAVADALGMVVVAPTDQRGMAGWTMEAREHEAAWAALRWVRRLVDVDETRIYATGVSRGAHLVWDLALRRPDRFAAIAPMIGGPLVGIQRGRNNLRYVENLVHVPIRDLQGSLDDPRLVANLRLTFKRLKALGAEDAKLIEFPEMGHAYDVAKVDWKAFFERVRRPAVPPRVIRRAARKGEGRAAWVEILETKSPTKEVFRLKFDPRTWRLLTAAKQRETVALEAEKHTARVEAEMTARSQFVVRTAGVKKLRLLLDGSMFVIGELVEVQLNGKLRKVRAKVSKSVLLTEFAERFDRTFVPIAELVLRP